MTRSAGHACGPADQLRRAARTGALLSQLLCEHHTYRRARRAQVVRAADSDPHQAAVARVVARYLWDVGEEDENRTDLPRQLKDVVARALSGRAISHQTLEWFIRAFEMSLPHEQALWEALETDLHEDATSGPPRAVRVPVRPAVSAAEASERAGYVTRSLIETYTLGPGRDRRAHHLMHVVEAVHDLDIVTYRFDPMTWPLPFCGAASLSPSRQVPLPRTAPAPTHWTFTWPTRCALGSPRSLRPRWPILPPVTR